MDITLVSVATVVNEPNTDLRSHMLDLNGPIRFERPILLHLAWKAVHSVQTYFSLSFSSCPLENYGWPTRLQIALT